MMEVSDAGKAELHASGRNLISIVARIWRGQTRPARASAYARYLYTHGVLKIERVPGNLGVTMLQSQKDNTTEFTVISYWPNREAIAAWSGGDLTRTRHLELDPDFLLALPERVELVDVLANDWELPQGRPR